MTIRDSLTSALATPMMFVVQEFGAPYLLRRMSTTTVDNPNGSVIVTAAVIGDDTPVPVVIEALSQAKLQKVWGQKTLATAQGTVLLSAGIVDGDFLIAMDGVSQDMWFEVLEQKPSDIGGISLLALQQVPRQVATDPLPGA